MADQTSILKALVAAGTPLALPDLCQAVDPSKDRTPRSRFRKLVINALGKLLSGKLITRDGTTNGFGPRDVRYAPTAAGVALVAACGTIKSGPKGKFNGLSRAHVGTMRQRLWEVLKLKQKATLGELVELVRVDSDPDEVKVTGNARKYLTALARAGIVTQLAQKAKGYAPTSNGFIRYALIRDLGQIAPTAGVTFVTDHNARERIPYQKEAR